MAIDDKAQMIILSAMIICLCLIGAMACMDSVSMPNTAMKESAFLSDAAVNNVIWAQGSGLEHAATASSMYTWQDRDQAAGRFKQETATVTDGLSSYLQKHGTAYQFSYDESAAAEYLADHPRPDAVNAGGILIEPYEGNARIYGCAYDVLISDGTTTYSIDRVASF